MSDAVKSFVAGGAGGMSLVLVGHPLDTMKVRMQTAPPGQYTGMMDCLGQIMKADGPRGLYRGMGAPLCTVTPMFAVYFWGFDQGKKLASGLGGPLVDKSTGSLTVAGICFGGAFSAIPGTVAMVPGDQVKVILQAQGSTPGAHTFAGPVDVVKHLWNKGGIRAFYKGTGLTLARDAPGSVGYYAGYELTKAQLCRWEGCEGDSSKLSTPSVLFAGGMAGVFNWIVAVPPDTIKSRYQSAAPGQYPGGVTQILKELIQKEGISGTYRGLGPAMVRAFPSNAACFFGYETAMRTMDRYF